MAAPALSNTANFGSKTQVFTLTQSGVNNGSVRLTLSRPILSLTVQVTGTFNGETITLTVGNLSGSEQTPIGGAITFTTTGIKAVVPHNAVGTNDRRDEGFMFFLFTWSATGASSNTVTTITAKYA